MFIPSEYFLIGHLKHAQTEGRRFSGLSLPLPPVQAVQVTSSFNWERRISSSIGERFSFLTKLKHCLHTGEDPLVDDQNERDINSVAGVLKLYFRGLENPLFPKERFQDLISTISKYFAGGMAHCFMDLYRSWNAGFLSCQAQEKDRYCEQSLVLRELKDPGLQAQ